MVPGTVVVRIGCIILGVSIGILLGPSRGQVAEFEISGEVLDAGNKGIDKVLVQVWRGNKVIGEDRTKQEGGGKYSVRFPGGSAIDNVTYDHSDYNAGKVPDLSGERDHSIKKVLYKIGSKLTPAQASEALSTMELIFHLQRANNVPVSELRGRYRRALQKLDVPVEFADRYKSILRLYAVETLG